jgi:hypothetical protein
MVKGVVHLALDSLRKRANEVQKLGEDAVGSCIATDDLDAWDLRTGGLHRSRQRCDTV